MELTDWLCAPSEADAINDPIALDANRDNNSRHSLDWIAATVPGTTASAWRAAGRVLDVRDINFDDRDWWFRTRFDWTAGFGNEELVFGGIATVADAWLNGQHLFHSSNMFREVRTDVAEILRERDNDLVVVCRALTPVLQQQRPRPRWKANFVDHQNLRWIRTSLMGRMPSWTMPAAPVGLWRSVTIGQAPIVTIAGPYELSAAPHCDTASGAGRDTGGIVKISIHLQSIAPLQSAMLDVDGCRVVLDLQLEDEMAVGHTEAPIIGIVSPTTSFRYLALGEVSVAHAERWWPATHGEQPLYRAQLICSTASTPHTIELPAQGFRVVDFDIGTSPRCVVNGTNIFIRGAWWVSPDPVGLAPTRDDIRDALLQLRGAGMNTVVIPASGTYETNEFFELCDELGIFVWQQLMFTRLDYPSDDEEWRADTIGEIQEALQTLSGHACVVMVCGAFETEQQRAMMGLDSSVDATNFFRTAVAELVHDVLPCVAYLADTPHGGAEPFSVNQGTATYYGIGAYGRPLTDARRAGVQFASGCLAFSNVPSIEAANSFIDRGAAIHGAHWKRAIPRDHGAAWDMEDTRDFYVEELFGIDPHQLRRTDPQRYLDVARAATSMAMHNTMTEWRLPNNPCNGALILQLRDYVDGAGCGIVDALGHPKPAYFAVKRALAPVAVVLSDEGLSGIDAWILNDSPTDISAQLVLNIFAVEHRIHQAQTAVTVAAHNYLHLGIAEVIKGFRDINYAFRFGPQAIVGVAAELVRNGIVLSRATFISAKPMIREVADIGLSAVARPLGNDTYRVSIGTRTLAQFVQVEGRDLAASDQGFDLDPGSVVEVDITTTTLRRARVRALNSRYAIPIESGHVE